MNASFLVDANILVYAYDRSEQSKQPKAQQLLRWLEWNDGGALSTQVLGEYFWTVTRKLPAPLPMEEGLRSLENYLRAWEILPITAQIVNEAGRGALEHQLPYWDAQIWATARLNQIPNVLSEDFSHERQIEGVKFINPFITSLWTEKDSSPAAN